MDPSGEALFAPLNSRELKKTTTILAVANTDSSLADFTPVAVYNPSKD
jgi:hypothetical protein